MKRSTLIGMLAGFYFGATLTVFTGIGFTDWRWWVIVIPTIALFQWEKNAIKNED
jgi:hypothetical protein